MVEQLSHPFHPRRKPRHPEPKSTFSGSSLVFCHSDEKGKEYTPVVSTLPQNTPFTPAASPPLPPHPTPQELLQVVCYVGSRFGISTVQMSKLILSCLEGGKLFVHALALAPLRLGETNCISASIMVGFAEAFSILTSALSLGVP